MNFGTFRTEGAVKVQDLHSQQHQICKAPITMDDIKDMEDFKLKVMGVNVFPMVKAGMKFQSDAKRREQTVSMSAPDPEGKPVLDWYDCKGENPYTVEEILPDKVWRVGYKMELMQYTRDDIQSCFVL